MIVIKRAWLCDIFTRNFDREWTEDGQLWVQYVSSTPATRLDIVNLQEHLDHQLQSRQARETGICPVREELYAQCFGASHCIEFFRTILYLIIFFITNVHFPAVADLN